ncbi:DUF3035 domain-containing protein [Pseudothioclava nitratireducens]|jgi:hypothetical protein|uniref:DUF3035 domain-containing protein n=1 Tax=Pseudothioclava nitratireducens TaxID=1928646 RepID=UPI0023DA8E3A|nr:DUF3035 domain-containing protein [Defluviimonas nitratireducens]MDF1620349.1 DUF3035 domain-containing protein [Defluviimonas nitratireducens]
MQAKMGKLWIAIAVAAMLSACSSDKEPRLMHLRSASSGPDEFAILPKKPLQMPPDLAALPEPVTGGKSLTDPTPEADAVAALGGNPSYLDATVIPAGDGALVAQTGRFGREGAIRETLAAEDLEHRRQNDGRVLERLFKTNVYYRAYRSMALDQEAELERWRKLGLRTPAAPPSAGAQDLSQ